MILGVFIVVFDNERRQAPLDDVTTCNPKNLKEAGHFRRAPRFRIQNRENPPSLFGKA